MNGLAEVVARLRHVIDGLDRAAVSTARAKADAEETRRRFVTAGKGSGSPVIRQAAADAEAASVAAGRASRLYAQAASRYANYLNHITPGSALAQPATDPMPSGEDIVHDANKRANIFRRASRTAVVNAEQAGDYSKKLADLIDAARPKGATAHVQAPAPPPAANTVVAPGDAAQAQTSGSCLCTSVEVDQMVRV